MTDEELAILGRDIVAYTKKFNIPLDFLFAILEDQKVTPMIRGKAMEYNAYLLLKNLLPRQAWDIQKLNLNAQTGLHDEDISITHRRTGVILKVECKSAVRGSAKDGRRSPLKRPGFNVKCHRSRSNISLASTSNDRYSVDSFDVIITNTSNAVFQGNTVSETLEILHNPVIKAQLYRYYAIDNDEDLKTASENDWRFCLPASIGVDGFIPRTPWVYFADDPNWHPIQTLAEKLLAVVDERRKSQTASRRS